MVETWHISINDKRTQQLMEKDSVLASLITDIGDVNRNLRTDPLKSIIRSIIGQQITVKAAAAIFERLTQKINNDWSVDTISKLTEEDMVEIGLSRPKQKYLFNLIEHINDNELEFSQFDKLSNEAIIKQLTAVKGIGKWTAEVFLIFTMQREDVVPIDDVGLQRAAKYLYKVPDDNGKELLKKCQTTWGDQATIGCLYLWAYIHKYNI
ncbi:DNA-3-methyladenine glycosylase family protein [Staphylococcus kloosii]|jgi:DNA-3-methyladenine glycosylase II|uniref:DNA-3-methyladenine glycosylase family protein n=1 Tax=Staphylococcus kloosii TaxID=29384 RepID=UPI00189CC026|nr:DNA-3-methyladenine glycosylase 2 family protein [Staphylococcus kloosii]MBF7025301.1 DNA-3-methyladenine glycosylase 2 family protein [Staphylococcus kloosii]